MTKDEEIATLRAENAAQATRITDLEAQVKALVDRLHLDSHNSSKPPSSDPPRNTPPRSLRKKSGKKSGGQIGHSGTTLHQVETPDTVVVHHPTTCGGCGGDLMDGVVTLTERRQVFELPELKLHVTEHVSQHRVCQHCHTTTPGVFPKEVTSRVQYGAGFRALAVYLVTAQFLPFARTCELLNTVFSESVSEGSLAAMLSACYVALEPREAEIVAAVRAAAVAHYDETGLRVAGQLQWLHVASTDRLTAYTVHARRGGAATDAMGILPMFEGVAVHDGWSSYRRYDCTHALCNAHHLRELTFVADDLKQDWANAMIALLLRLKTEVETARAAGQTTLSGERRLVIEAEYHTLLAAGLMAHAPPEGGWPKSARGKAKKSKARNLVERLQTYADDVLRFVWDFRVPFDNNQAERDLRMMKVQQKVSGGFRTEQGARIFCRIRSYLSTMHKRGHNIVLALYEAFCGQPLTLAAVPE